MWKEGQKSKLTHKLFVHEEWVYLVSLLIPPPPGLANGPTKDSITAADAWDQGSRYQQLYLLGCCSTKIWLSRCGTTNLGGLIHILQPWKEELMAPLKDIIFGGKWAGFF